MSQSFLRLTLIILIGLECGCAEKKPGTPSPSSHPEISALPSIQSEAFEPPSPQASPDARIRNIELLEANWSEVLTLVSQHNGKVVIVDVWSTACEPCMKEFPNLIALQHRYPFDVVTISFDIDFAGIRNKPPAYYRERVVEFLASQAENNVIHRMANTPADELFTELKLDSIPAVYVYGRDGTLAKRFDGSSGDGEGVSYESQVFPFVEGLLKQVRL